MNQHGAGRVNTELTLIQHWLARATRVKHDIATNVEKIKKKEEKSSKSLQNLSFWGAAK